MFPHRLQQQLDSYDDNAPVPLESFNNSANASKDDNDIPWIQETMAFYSKILTTKPWDRTLGTNNWCFSDTDLLLKLWRPVYDIFLDTDITATTTGTGTGTAHASEMDLVFKYDNLALGGGEIDNKVIVGDHVDHSLKAPKCLKDMLARMVDRCPEKKSELQTIGLMMTGQHIQLISLDIPFSNICRLTRTPLFKLPLMDNNNTTTLQHDIQPIIQLVWKSLQVMKRNAQLISSTRQLSMSHLIDTIHTLVPSTSCSLRPSFTPSSPSSSSLPPKDTFLLNNVEMIKIEDWTNFKAFIRTSVFPFLKRFLYFYILLYFFLPCYALRLSLVITYFLT
ncbi:unnamed protein product [Absidia cylindrospora]